MFRKNDNNNTDTLHLLVFGCHFTVGNIAISKRNYIITVCKTKTCPNFKEIIIKNLAVAVTKNKK